MQCTIFKSANTQLLKPSQYLTHPFKTYILEHLLQQLLKSTILSSFKTIKKTNLSQKTAKSQRKRTRGTKIRTEWDENPSELSHISYTYSNNSYHQLTSKYQSPYRSRDSERPYKTQYLQGIYTVNQHSGRQGAPYAQNQLKVPSSLDYFSQIERQYVSPYRKKDNVSVVDVNYSAERQYDILSPHSKGLSESRLKQQQQKNIRMEWSLKRCAARLMMTTIKFIAYRSMLSFFRNVKIITITQEKHEAMKVQQTLKVSLQKQEIKSAEISQQLCSKVKQIESINHKLRIKQKDQQFTSKLSILTKINAKYTYITSQIFKSMHSISQTRFIAISSPSEEQQQQFTIIYDNDEAISNQTAHKVETMTPLSKFQINLSQNQIEKENVQHSHRSGATNCSIDND